MCLSRCLYDSVQGRVTLGKFAMFGEINVGKCPGVFEGGPGGSAADGGGVVAVGIERGSR